jgi:nitric oxide reductase subunit C
VTGEAPRALPGVEARVDAERPDDRGRSLFHGAGACAGCHSVAPGVHLVGPSLAGIAITAGERVADPSYHGKANGVEEYLRESILAPSLFVAPGGNFATPDGRSFMPDHYTTVLDAGQVDDLIAYLISLR